VIAAQEGLADLQPVYFNPDALDRGFDGTAENLVTDLQVDKVTLAAGILWPGISPLSGNYTYYEGVRRLQPGDVTTITQEGKLDVRSEYPTENHSLTFDEVACMAGEAIRQCIATSGVHEMHQLSSDCSGGVDSTTLALAAAAQCPTDSNVLGLVQYSDIYPAGDITYARRFAKLSDRLMLRELVTTAKELPFITPPPADISPSEPYRGTAIYGRENQRLMMARPHHLIGEAGDALFDPEPIAPLADLLLSGEYDLARNMALHLGRAALVSPEAILENARAKASTNLVGSYERVSGQLTSDHLLAPSQDWLPSLGTASTWITPELREALAARAQTLAAQAPDITFSAYATQQSIRNSVDAYRHLRMVAEKHGVDLIAPYLDETVLRSVIALPAASRIQPGQFKPLLQAVSKAADLAPAELFSRQGKGAYTSELQAGFKMALPRIKEQLQKSRLAHMGIINPEAVQASLTHKTPPWASLTQLLASEAWLAHLGVEAPKTTHSTIRHTSTVEPTKEAPKPLANAYAIPSSLHISPGQDGKLFAFDHVAGSFHILPLNSTAQLILKTLAQTHSPQLALDALQADYPNIPAERLATDLTSAIHDFVRQGWLEPTDANTIWVKQLSQLNLPPDMAHRVIAYIQSLEESIPIDAHHFACAVTGHPTSMEEANDRAANIVRNGEEISAEDLPVGGCGVIGVLKSAHGLTHGLHSVIGLGDGKCLSVIARQGNIGIAPVENFLTYYKQWLESIGFPGDTEKVKLYTMQPTTHTSATDTPSS